MFTEDDFIMISALQHYQFCPRQCGLIHVDNAWSENLYTTRGNLLHDKVDSDTYENRGGVKTVRGMRIHSLKYGIVGRCDVVEFHQKSAGRVILPVEFKAGKPKSDMSDEVQLCAQAMCLEEMLETEIPNAEFFYGKIRRRVQVKISAALKAKTAGVIDLARKIIDSRKVPAAEYSSKCRNCSLYEICQPKAQNKKKLVNYINELYKT